MANHLCVKLLSEAPQSYADSFLRLGNAGYLPKDLAGRLAKMAAFQDLLVHRYGEIDDGLMLKIMREDLHDLDLLLAAIQKIVGKE
jgi:uncharacterized protein YutE (UPF0331/DUF86 family)